MRNPKRILFVIAYLATPLLFGWLGYGIYTGVGSAPPPPILSANEIFYDLPVISIGGIDGMEGTLQLALSLKVPRTDARYLPGLEPRIAEKIVFFMRRQKPQDFESAGGEERLREGLSAAISQGAAPIPISRIAIREMVVD